MAQLKRQPDGNPTELTETLTIIGRSSSCQFSIDDVADLSREHCGVHKYEDGSYTLEDYSSRNGTFLNDKQIFEETPINHCDTIRLGKYVEMAFTNPPRRSGRPDPLSEASQVLLRAAPSGYLGAKTVASEDVPAPPAIPATPAPPASPVSPELSSDPEMAVDMIEQFRRAVKDRR
ncbi:MAG: putative component of type VI protein secretion system [Rhodothermales bacterium]|jgi:predicted component of type VI protein secretion system